MGRRYSDSLRDRVLAETRFPLTDQNDVEVHSGSCTTGTGFLPWVKRPERGDDQPSLSSIRCECFAAIHLRLHSVPALANHGLNIDKILGNCTFMGHGA